MKNELENLMKINQEKNYQNKSKTIKDENQDNLFINNLFKKDTYTENGALSNSTTGDIIVDDFSNAGSYRDRSLVDVFNTMDKLWHKSPEKALQSIFYLRNITRKVKGFITLDELQKGQGNKDESIKRLLWLAYFQPKVFEKNSWLIPVVGYWKDLFTLLTIDFENRIDKNKIFDLILKGLSDEYNIDLVKKYLPSIKSTKKTNTTKSIILNQIAKDLAKYMNVSHKEYRLLKSSGKAHEFQQYISKGLYDDIDFNKIPGKALTEIATNNFLSNHNLENKFLNWLEDSNSNIKFNGYVYELANKINYNMNIITKKTIDLQFESLINTMKEDGDKNIIKGNVLCALDTSASMERSIGNGKTTAYEVCISLGIYFSNLNNGYFKDVVAMFDNTSYIKKLNGGFSTKYQDLKDERIAWGSTNFQSIIDMLVKMRKENPNIPLSDYPETILVVSDMQFNPSGGYGYNDNIDLTNYQMAIEKLSEVGLNNIKFIWWDVTSDERKDYPSTLNDLNTYMFSGFDGSIITELLGGEIETKEEENNKPISMEELLEKVYNQELFKQLKL
jgi:hypothetical protein